MVTVPIKKKKLEDLLVKIPNETEQFFLIRSQYSKISEKLFPKYPPLSHILLGRMGTERLLLGLKYPEETDRVLDYIDSVIKSI